MSERLAFPCRLRATNNSWIIERRLVKGERSKNPGEVYFRPDTHHTSMESMCNSLLEMLLRKKASEIEEKDSLVEQVKLLRSEVESSKKEIVSHFSSLIIE